jgi:CubicO group peptidase (beta-lactamase class C family)
MQHSAKRQRKTMQHDAGGQYTTITTRALLTMQAGFLTSKKRELGQYAPITARAVDQLDGLKDAYRHLTTPKKHRRR